MENVFTFLPTFFPLLMDFSFSLSWMCPSRYKNSNFPQRVTHNPVSEFNRFLFHRSREFGEGKCWHQTENANDPNDIWRNVHFVCLRHDSRYVPTIWTFLDFYDSPFHCSNVLFNALPSNKIPRLLFPFQIAVIRYYLKIPINGALNDKTFTALKPGLVDIAQRIWWLKELFSLFDACLAAKSDTRARDGVKSTKRKCLISLAIMKRSLPFDVSTIRTKWCDVWMAFRERPLSSFKVEFISFIDNDSTKQPNLELLKANTLKTAWVDPFPQSARSGWSREAPEVNIAIINEQSTHQLV